MTDGPRAEYGGERQTDQAQGRHVIPIGEESDDIAGVRGAPWVETLSPARELRRAQHDREQCSTDKQLGQRTAIMLPSGISQAPTQLVKPGFCGE